MIFDSIRVGGDHWIGLTAVVLACWDALQKPAWRYLPNKDAWLISLQLYILGLLLFLKKDIIVGALIAQRKVPVITVFLVVSYLCKLCLWIGENTVIKWRNPNEFLFVGNQQERPPAINFSRVRITNGCLPQFTPRRFSNTKPCNSPFGEAELLQDTENISSAGVPIIWNPINSICRPVVIASTSLSSFVYFVPRRTKNFEVH